MVDLRRFAHGEGSILLADASMVSLKSLSVCLESPMAYRLWQAPFARAKLAPVLRHNDLAAVRRVLDVGCGPGTNAAVFGHADYHGCDLDARYIEYARRHYRGQFTVADVRQELPAMGEPFDCILVNSLMHHLSDDEVSALLTKLAGRLAPDGAVHVLDLVLPERACVARWLAHSDRGEYPRRLVEWQRMIAAAFTVELVEPYAIGLPGLALWNMVYLRGRRPS